MGRLYIFGKEHELYCKLKITSNDFICIHKDKYIMIPVI